MINTFSEESIDRISRVVRDHESKQPVQGAQRRVWPLGGDAGTKPTLYVASEDIDHNTLGNVKAASNASYIYPYLTTGDDIEIANVIGQKIWQGANVIAEPVTLAAAGDSRSVAMRTNSATILHGTLDTETASQIWNVDIVAGVNGFYDTNNSGSVAKAKVLMPHANDELVGGTNVFILHDPTKKDGDAWEFTVVSADCIPE